MPGSKTSLLRRLFGPADPRERMAPLYAAVVAQALLRLQQLGAAQEGAWLTELFIDDMDGQLRQQGIGDVVVGKHVGRMMGALGGRLSAYRCALAGEEDFGEALIRNLYRGDAPAPAALAHAEQGLRALWATVQTRSLDPLRGGMLA